MTVTEQIFKAFDSGKTVVFPTETSARSFLSSYLKSRPGKAVLTEKALSFDTYLKNITRYPSGKSASMSDRVVFADSFIKRSEKELKYFKRSSIREVFKALPEFKRLSETNGLQKELSHDITLILEEYEKYLAKRGLYEESYYTAEDCNSENTVYAFSSSYLQKVDLKEEACINPSNELPVLNIFPNTLAEIRHCIRKVSSLVKNGTKARDIAITVTDLSSTENILRREAEKHGLILAFMQGKSLSQYPSGRMFPSISKIYSEDFSLESLKEFLLDSVYPFKEKEKAVNLVRLSIECNCEDGGKNASTLKRKLEVSKDCKAPEVLDYLIKLSNYVKGICEASDCDSLRKALKGFQDDFFMPGSWNATNNEKNILVFQRCMSALDELESQLCDSSIIPDNLYSLFCLILDNTNYVFQDVEGIKVYSYPLSAGLMVENHFVLGLDDSLSRVSLDKNPFGGRLSNIESSWIGDNMIRSYCFEQKNLNLSCSLETYTGNSIAPALFVEKGKTNPINESESDSYYDEEDIWSGKQPNHKATKLQRDSFLKALDSSFSAGNKLTWPCPEAPYKVTASRLNNFETCAFRYMCANILCLDEIVFESQMVDHKKLGDILHETYEDWLNEIKYFDRACDEESLEKLDKILEEKLRKYSYEASAPGELYLSYFKRKYSKQLAQIINSKEVGAILGETAIEKTEKYFEIEYDKYKVTGFIDAIFKTSDGNYVVIDFKKGKAPKAKTQLAIYAKALEKLPVRGAFYSIGEQKFAVGFENEVELKQIIDDCDSLIARNIEALEKNNFEMSPNSDNCSNCPYTRICRKRYVVK